MIADKHCKVEDCAHSVVASIDGEDLCRSHFVAQCYARIDQYNDLRKGPGLKASDTEGVRRFIQECTRQADEIEHKGTDLDNLDRAKLLHIILSAGELGCYLRRSPRKVASIPVQIRSEKLGRAWEEHTETVLLSRYGASVRCSHAAKPGETLQVMRADTGQTTEARVIWLRPVADDDTRVGVEFVDCENFWGLDWAAVENAR